MRRIITSANLSLDGAIDEMERWHFMYFDDEAGAVADEQLFASDALLMGRATYEGFSTAWPDQTGEFADHFNAMPKYVVSDSLQEAGWNNVTIIRRAHLVDEIARLKKQDGKDILMYGFGPVARTLVEHGLLDEARFWLHPAFAGTTKSEHLLASEGFEPHLTLAGSQVLTSGIVVLRYRATPREA
ncbi:MAG: hypothetical protein GEV10_12200 [Streptosporangiales bacterium]|nr:hypothetical protein [Streptosporangiales bacterium]